MTNAAPRPTHYTGAVKQTIIITKYFQQHKKEPRGVQEWVFVDGDKNDFKYYGNYPTAAREAKKHFPYSFFIFLKP